MKKSTIYYIITVIIMTVVTEGIILSGSLAMILLFPLLWPIALLHPVVPYPFLYFLVIIPLYYAALLLPLLLTGGNRKKLWFTIQLLLVATVVGLFFVIGEEFTKIPGM